MSSSLTGIQALEHGLAILAIETAAEPLMDYLFLLDKWNRAYNLTGVKDLESMITRHLLDSLAISPWIFGTRLLDVGAGAGLPGIPLAIANPELRVTLLDSNGKKTRFMQEAKRVLKLDNIEIIQNRVENYHPTDAFDTVTSRAFSDLAQMICWTKHLIAVPGKWLAMKGRFPEAELAAIQHDYQIKTYSVPGLDGERCCVLIDNI
ncbi:MAG: 16S rRNA (guanine(527)-N(7))-methyltransferase RsmG [Legionella sp.]|nr:16S rRNA (guanine(527)-N(7))-methyltransferase RsmG [Legionella sp.]